MLELFSNSYLHLAFITDCSKLIVSRDSIRTGGQGLVIMPFDACRYEGSSALNINLIVIFIFDLSTLQNDDLTFNSLEFIEAYDTFFLFIKDIVRIFKMLSLNSWPRHVRLPLSLQILDDLGLSVFPLCTNCPLMNVMLAVLDQVNYYGDQEDINYEKVVSYPYD